MEKKTTYYNNDNGSEVFNVSNTKDKNTNTVGTKVTNAYGNSSTLTQGPTDLRYEVQWDIYTAGFNCTVGNGKMDMSVDGNIAIRGISTVEGNSNVEGNSTVELDMSVLGDHDVGGDQIITGDQSVDGNQYVEGNSDIVGALNVGGSFTAEGPKNFRIDHPFDTENKYLLHAAMESNEVLNQYSGNVTTDNNGKAKVELPDYFEEINIDFRYQLTVVGQFAQAIIYKEISNNLFGIKTDKPNVKVSWQVTARRNDTYMRENPYKEVIEK